MAEFASWQSYGTFAWSVKRKARYVFEDNVDEFLRTVIATSEGRKRAFPSGRVLWRAQYGHDWETIRQDADEFEVPAPFPSARMKPLPDSAREGRVNPKGIPCLYLATDKETAMAEVRPWLGSYISVGQFRTPKDLVLVDCSVDHGRASIVFFEEPDQREKAVWGDIDKAFSEPASSGESTADYAPTQIIAESFRRHGYDGIAYKSVLGTGFNVALFNLNAADLINCFLYEAKKLVFEFDETGRPYFVKKYYESKDENDAQQKHKQGRS